MTHDLILPVLQNLPSGLGAPAASHPHAGPLPAHLGGLLPARRHDDKSGSRSPFQVSE